jgi:hypothetical protein
LHFETCLLALAARPGEIVGLPAGLGLAPGHPILLRYVLLLIAVAWAALAARRGARAWVAGIAFVDVVLAFWIAGFERPYGVLLDPAITRSAAEVSTAALPGEPGFIAGEAAPPSIAGRLAAMGVSADLLIALPSLLPLLVAPAVAAVVALLARPADQAALAALLWLAFSTGEAEAEQGYGFITGLWRDPARALAFVALLAAVLALARLRPRGLGIALAMLALTSVALLPAAASPPLLERLSLAVIGLGPWLALGSWGLWRGASAAAWALVAGGGVMLLVAPALRPVDTWAPAALLRMGFVLASAAPVQALLREGVQLLVAERAWRRVAASPGAFGLAVLVLAATPGSFLAHWDPAALDPLALESRSALPDNLRPAMAWIRENVPEDRACVASPSYAAFVAVLGGRRVLRAPALAQPRDDQRRRRTERMLVAAREPDLLRRYGIGCFVFASGDQGWLGIDGPADLDRLPRLRLGYADAHARVYEVRP